MQKYYEELLQYNSSILTHTSRTKLASTWPIQDFPCKDVFLDFYECFQNTKGIREQYLIIYPIEHIMERDDALIFAEAHERAYPIGIQTKDLAFDCPQVKYFISSDNTWYVESGSLKSYLFNVAGWHIVNSLHSLAKVKLQEVQFKTLVGKSLFDFTSEKQVTLSCQYRVCHNMDKDILGCYSKREGFLYLGAASDEILNNFGAFYQLDLDWL